MSLRCLHRNTIKANFGTRLFALLKMCFFLSFYVVTLQLLLEEFCVCRYKTDNEPHLDEPVHFTIMSLRHELCQRPAATKMVISERFDHLSLM